RELEASGYEVNALRLHSEPRVPANCDLLLIASPESVFELEDRVKVNDYLLQGGRLLVALSQADTGLETLLDGYDVRVLPGRVLERQVRGPRADWSPTFLAR